jgi:hypothetical protein
MAARVSSGLTLLGPAINFQPNAITATTTTTMMTTPIGPLIFAFIEESLPFACDCYKQLVEQTEEPEEVFRLFRG